MIRLFPSRLSIPALVVVTFWSLLARALAKVEIASIQVTYGEDAGKRVPSVIDGRDTGTVGWSVFPRTGEEHSLLAKLAAPVHAQAFDLTFCFLTGQPKRYFGRFAISYTTDPEPSFAGKWERVVPQSAIGTGASLVIQADGVMVSNEGDSMIGDAIFQVRVPAPAAAVTGFRVDVFPFERASDPGPRVAWNEYRDFCLTELRIEPVQPSATTNIALGCPVKASHPLWAGTSASVLTDGLPGSFNHPADAGLGSAFHYDLDLGSVRDLDHISLRNRADGYGPDRLSRVRLQLFEGAPDRGGKPTWEGMARADGSHPGPAEVETVRAAEGSGWCSGRYLRISSDSPVSNSPQLAEVEVYPKLTPHLASVKADGRALPGESHLTVPPGTAVLALTLEIPGPGLPENLPLRWRLRGWHDDWQVTSEPLIEISQPLAGEYRFEAQVSHSDREWDASLLTLAVAVRPHFWQTPLFLWSVPGAVLAAGFLVIRRAARQEEEKRLAALRYQSALAEERSRIARDMHDEVGARLSQLALMQDLIAREPQLPADARESLQELSVTTREAVNALDHVVWTVNPQHDTLGGVATYLSHVATSYLAPVNIACRLDLPLEWPEVQVRAQVRHELILAFREALQNVVKHAQADAVTFTMRYVAPELHVVVSDNGQGLSGDLAGPGREGLGNMRSRLERIGGHFRIQARPEGGTVVEMTIPLGSSR